MKKIKTLYKSREKIMKLFNDYSKIASEVTQNKMWRRTQSNNS